MNFNLIKETNETITKEAQESKNLNLLEPNVVIIAIYGLESTNYRGKCAILGVPSTINQACLALYPNKNFLSTFFLFYWYSYIGEMYEIKYSQGTTQKNFNINIIKNFPITLPTKIEEQEKISRFLTTINEKNKKIKDNRRILINFKKYLLKNLFI